MKRSLWGVLALLVPMLLSTMPAQAEPTAQLDHWACENVYRSDARYTQRDPLTCMVKYFTVATPNQGEVVPFCATNGKLVLGHSSDPQSNKVEKIACNWTELPKHALRYAQHVGVVIVLHGHRIAVPAAQSHARDVCQYLGWPIIILETGQVGCDMGHDNAAWIGVYKPAKVILHIAQYPGD